MQFAQAKQNRRNANVGAFQNVAVKGIDKIQDLGGFGAVFGQQKQETQEELNKVAGDE